MGRDSKSSPRITSYERPIFMSVVLWLLKSKTKILSMMSAIEKLRSNWHHNKKLTVLFTLL